MTAAICHLCGRGKPANLPVCRDCLLLHLSRISQKRAARAAIETKRAARRLELITRRLDAMSLAPTL